MYHNNDLISYTIYEKKFIFYKNKLDKTYKKLKKLSKKEIINRDKIKKYILKMEFYLILTNNYNMLLQTFLS